MQEWGSQEATDGRQVGVHRTPGRGIGSLKIRWPLGCGLLHSGPTESHQVCERLGRGKQQAANQYRRRSRRDCLDLAPPLFNTPRVEVIVLTTEASTVDLRAGGIAVRTQN